jgi:hypothetical protein
MAIRNAGPGVFLKRARSAFRDFALRTNYNRWIARHETLTQADRQKVYNDIGRFPRRPVISVMMPVAGSHLRILSHRSIPATHSQRTRFIASRKSSRAPMPDYFFLTKIRSRGMEPDSTRGSSQTGILQ